MSDTNLEHACLSASVQRNIMASDTSMHLLDGLGHRCHGMFKILFHKLSAFKVT